MTRARSGSGSGSGWVEAPRAGFRIYWGGTRQKGFSIVYCIGVGAGTRGGKAYTSRCYMAASTSAGGKCNHLPVSDCGLPYVGMGTARIRPRRQHILVNLVPSTASVRGIDALAQTPSSTSE